jgi:hypothetical protein
MTGKREESPHHNITQEAPSALIDLFYRSIYNNLCLFFTICLQSLNPDPTEEEKKIKQSACRCEVKNQRVWKIERTVCSIYLGDAFF